MTSESDTICVAAIFALFKEPPFLLTNANTLCWIMNKEHSVIFNTHTQLRGFFTSIPSHTMSHRLCKPEYHPRKPATLKRGQKRL